MIDIDITPCLLPSLGSKNLQLGLVSSKLTSRGRLKKKSRQLATVQKHFSLALLIGYDIDSKRHQTSAANSIT